MQITNNEIKVSQPTLQLQELARRNFTGSLLIQNNKDLSWKIYFRLGRLIWITGEGIYFQEQWKRHIDLFFSNLINAERSMLLKQNKDRYYNTLAQLYRQGNAAEKQNITDLITSIFVENIFDIIQYNYANKEELLYESFPNEKPETLVTLIKTDSVNQKATTNWEKWLEAGLSDYSPNLFPAIENLQTVQKELNPEFISIIDGTKSLRTLAAKINLNLVTLTKSLISFIAVGGVSLNPVPSLKKVALEPVNLEESTHSHISNNFISENQKDSSFLVFCVDDSSVICQNMERIISDNSYRFMSVQNPVKAIPLIIKSSPDLIFLDLMMPIINGYELCSKLRKIPNFKDIPIVILTGKDGLVDRVRAKVVGATAFISKPPKPEEVLGLVHKHLPV